jgi:opacity protein-like surface antigen
VHLASDGFLGFELSAERFTKEGSRGWDGRVEALLLSVWPMAEYDPLEGLGVFVGPGVVYVDGSYSGTDDFGRYVEAEGSSAGFGLSVGASVDLWGPVSGRLDYRRTFIAVETDRATVDGSESVVYPPQSTDLSYGRLGLSLVVSLLGADRSVLNL